MSKVAKAVVSAEEWSAKKFALVLERERADLAARLVTHTHPLPGQAEDLARAEWWARDRDTHPQGSEGCA